MGRVDLHNHILFELDDGANDAAESLALARALVDAGYTDVATTPHAHPEMDPPADAARARLAELQALLERERIPLRLHAGREHHLTPTLLERVAAKAAQTLGDGKYLLVELPFATPVIGLRERLFQIMVRGLRPIVAHPERCAHFVGRLDAARELVDAGAHLQIEVGSLAGIYGGPAKKCAQALLDEGLVAVAATDSHHLKSAREILTAGLKAMTKALGATRTELLTEENPGRVLQSLELLPS